MSIVNTKNAAHLAKIGMDSAATTAFLASAVIAIGIATKTIAISYLPASLGFLGALATPLGITILLGLTAYFALSAFTSFQQLQENKDLEANIDCVSKNCSKNRFIDLSTVADPFLKDAKIIEKDDNGKKSLHLTFTTEAYKALVGDKQADAEVTVYAILNGKEEVPLTLKHVAPAEAANGENTEGKTTDATKSKATDHTVQLVKVGDKDQVADMKAKFGNWDGKKPLKVSVSKENLDTLRKNEELNNGVRAKLVDHMINQVVGIKR
ncbi:hypothetical protein [Wolbachia endosymbiont (group E) of Neria commutata]|uniref:hypothetical protein n=1 Tax=Wolbachia endosymbiont (group E) of Neria commutata TaxID=3066149 RepID=UPI0031333FF0